MARKRKLWRRPKHPSPMSRGLLFEAVEPRRLLAAEPVISEFMASNRATLQDGRGDWPDWIELSNQGDVEIDLAGWHLTDNARQLAKWTFPPTTLFPGQLLVVFASGADIRDPGGNLHTNFRISQAGEFLALVEPDGQAIATQFTDLPEQLTDVSYGFRMDTNGRLLAGTPGYFDQPTPRAVNPSSFALGPQIELVQHQPLRPQVSDPLFVTAHVAPRLGPVHRVSLTYRVMFDGEQRVDMSDDGQLGDVVAGDGIYTGVIPAGVAESGRMIRYAVDAIDQTGAELRAPRVIDTRGDDQSPVYFGTVVYDPSAERDGPVLHWFTTDVAAAHSRDGARASVFYGTEFYDNILVRERGGFTNAASQKFEFNEVQPFWVNETLGRVDEINLNGNGDDPSFVRQPLAFEAYRRAGVPAPEAFLLPMRVNGRLDRLSVFVEQVDESLLRRYGLDPAGALYKFVQRDNIVSSAPALADLLTGVEKKTRLNEDLTDLQQLIDGLNLPSVASRRQFMFEHLNLPQVINELAVRTVVADADDIAKNFYLYRDTNGSGEWSIIPWDKDRTFGEPTEPITDKWFLTHPFSGSGGNALYSAVFNDPMTRELYLRRLRSVMDELLQPPDAVQVGDFERRVDALFREFDDLLGDGVEQQVQQLKSYFAPHREWLFERHSVDRQTDFDQLQTLIPAFAENAQYYVPVDNSLGSSWTELLPPENFREWSSGRTGIGFERQPEEFRDLIHTSVNPADRCISCTSVFVRIPFEIAEPAQITDLTLRMKYDDGFVAYLNGTEIARRNVVGPPSFDTRAQGHLDSEAVVFENILISEHRSLLRAGQNMLAIQAVNLNAANGDLLVLPELVSGKFGDDTAAGVPRAQVAEPRVSFGEYEARPASGRSGEAYLTVVNGELAAVDISEWQLRGSVTHRFPPGTVIPASGRLYIAADVQAFRQRPDSPLGEATRLVQGNFLGSLIDPQGHVELINPAGVIRATLELSPGLPGDFDQDGQVDVTDLDRLCHAVAARSNGFDVNGDQVTDRLDVQHFVTTIKGTVVGDANLDGAFDSRDLVQIFQVGTFAGGPEIASVWSGGDWDCDGQFTEADLVAAFQAGGYVAERTSAP